jgi:signal transduction histidine kinase
VRPDESEDPEGRSELRARIETDSYARLLLVIREGRVASRVPLTGTVVEIGRDGSNDICIPSAEVSRFHARLERRPNGWFVVDRDAPNHVFVNDLRVTEARLSSGDVIGIAGAAQIVYVEVAPVSEIRSVARLAMPLSEIVGDELDQIGAVARAIANDEAVKASLDRVLAAVMETLDAERGFIVPVDGTALRLEEGVARRLDPAGRAFATSIVQKALASRELQVFERTLGVGEETDSMLDLRLVRVVAAPLLVKDRCVGVIYADARAGRIRWQDMKVLRILAHQAAIAVEHSRVYLELRAAKTELEERYRSERERAEAQLAEMHRMEALGQLAAGVAHEFRNILGIVELSTQALAAGARDHEAIADDILEGCRRGNDLVRQLLIIGRGAESQRREIDACEHVSGAVRLFQRTLPKSIRVVSNVPDAPAWIDFDPGQLSQALLNLGLNARDAMPNGGLLVFEVEHGTMEEAAGPEWEPAPWMMPGPAIAIRVSDTGIGMDDDIRDRIFEPFFTTKSDGGGSGLGLAIVYTIVREHGGVIRARSRPGRGTTFTMLLPTLPR